MSKDVFNETVSTESQDSFDGVVTEEQPAVEATSEESSSPEETPTSDFHDLELPRFPISDDDEEVTETEEDVEVPEEVEAPEEATVEPITAEQGTEGLSQSEISARYFQSENDKLKNQLTKLERLGQLDQYLQENPQAVDAIQSALSGETTAIAQTVPVAEPTAPEPEKPADFDPFEAYNDENSTSYRYRQALEAHQRSHAEADIANRVSTIVDQRMSQFKATQDSQARQQTARNQMEVAMTKAGYTKDQQADLYTWLNDGMMQSPSDVIAAHQAVRGMGTANKEKVAGRKEQFDRVKKNQGKPASAATVKGAAVEQKSDSDAFLEGLVSNRPKY